MAQMTFNPSSDGEILRDSVNQTWANIVAGAGTYIASSANLGSLEVHASSTSNQFERIQRGYFVFDTSGLPDSATITSATLTLYDSGYKRDELLMADSLSIIEFTPDDSTSIVVGDFDNCGTTVFSSIAYSSLTDSDGGSNVFTLNASGRATISLSGYTEFALRWNDDIDGSFGGTWTNGGRTEWNYYLTENESSLPVLTVNYTTPTTSSSSSSSSSSTSTTSTSTSTTSTSISTTSTSISTTSISISTTSTSTTSTSSSSSSSTSISTSTTSTSSSSSSSTSTIAYQPEIGLVDKDKLFITAGYV